MFTCSNQEGLEWIILFKVPHTFSQPAGRVPDRPTAPGCSVAKRQFHHQLLLQPGDYMCSHSLPQWFGTHWIQSKNFSFSSFHRGQSGERQSPRFPWQASRLHFLHVQSRCRELDRLLTARSLPLIARSRGSRLSLQYRFQNRVSSLSDTSWTYSIIAGMYTCGLPTEVFLFLF